MSAEDSNDRDAVEVWRERLTAVSEPRSVKPRPKTERPRTVDETAEELGLSVYTIRSWIADRRLLHLRLGRAIRIPAEEIRRVLEESTIPVSRKR